MSGYINSIRKGIGKLLGKGADDAPEPKPKGADEGPEPKPEDDGPAPHPLDPSPLTPEESSFNIPRTKKLVEGMQEEPHPDLMSMGRPDDGNINLSLLQEDPRIRQAAALLDQDLGVLARDKKVPNIDTLKKLGLAGEEEKVFVPDPKKSAVQNKEAADLLDADNLRIRKAKEEGVITLTRAVNKGPDLAYTPDEIVALGTLNREVTEVLTENTQKLIDNINNDTISQQELLALSYLEDLAIEAQRKWIDSGTVSARALQVRNALKKNPTSPIYQEAAKEITDIKGGRLVLKERLKLYAEGRDVADVMKRVNMTWIEEKYNQAWKGIFFLRYNAMLSGLSTHVANITGSSFVALNERLVVKPLMVAFNKAEQGIRHMAGRRLKDMSVDETMLWREMRGDWQATKVGLGRGLSGARDIVKGKKITDGKFFNEIGTRYDVNDIPKNPVGKGIGMVTRALEAEDAVFRGINYQQEVARLAMRRAKNTFPDNDEKFAALYTELLNHPPPDISKPAREFAEYAVFANDPNLYSNLFGTVTKGAGWMQQNSKMAQIFMPFVKVVGNLAIYGKNHALAPLSSKLYQDIIGKDPVRRAHAMALFTESIGIGAILYNFWEDGLITGLGHPDKDARISAARAGFPPNSIKIDDNWYTISRLDPLGMILGLWATGFEQWESTDGDPATTAVNTALAVGQLLQDRAMLAATADVFEVLSGNGSESTKADVLSTALTLGTLTIVQPGAARMARNMSDPIRRSMEAENTAEGWAERGKKRFMNAWPGFSNNLPPRRDWRGEIIVNQMNAIARGVIPVSRTEAMVDDATLALLNYDIDIRKADKTLSLPGAGIKLNLLGVDKVDFLSTESGGWGYNKYTEVVGKEQARQVDLIMPGLKSMMSKAIKNGEIADGQMYETVQDLLSQALSRGKRIAKFTYLDWLDGRETIPGKVINDETGERQQVPVTEIFSWGDYPDIDRKALLGEIDIKDIDLYTKKGTTILPAIREAGAEQTVEF